MEKLRDLRVDLGAWWAEVNGTERGMAVGITCRDVGGMVRRRIYNIFSVHHIPEGRGRAL